MILGLLGAFDDVLVEPFMPNRAVVALDVGVLLGLPGLDVLDCDALFLGPYQQLATDVFRAVTPSERRWLRGYDRLRSPQIAQQVVIAESQVPTVVLHKPHRKGDRP